MIRNKPHICFVAPAAWPILSGDRKIKSVGGAEVQQCFIARSLVKAGYRVTMICMDYGQQDGVEIDGVRVLKAHTPDGGLPILRFVYPRFTSIWAAMRRANADIYYQRSGAVHTGYVGVFCRLYARKFVYAAAHDADFDAALPLIRYRRDKAIYSWGLRHAHAVVVQNPIQARLCKRLLGIEPRLIKSCYAPPLGMAVDSRGYVLWVSTMRKWKHPELFIELARQLPQYKFRMVGGADNSTDFEQLNQSAVGLPNLEFKGFVPHAEIEAQFNGARLFVNTSEHEGFPNTFLQAWARSMPTVSFVDTGSVVDGEPVVIRVNDMGEMQTAVDRLMSDDVAWSEAGRRGIACYTDQHSLQAVTNEYERLFLQLHKADLECRAG